MTENKRFEVSSMMGDYYVQDNHIPVEKDKILFFGHSSQCKSVCECLNALHEENTTIKQTIKQAYETEKTKLGKSVLKQLINQME